MSSPVTISVKRETHPERVSEALDWIDEGLSLARRFDGFLGGGVMCDAEQEHVLHVVYRFKDRQTLDHWDHSDARRNWSLAGERLASTVAVQRRTGIEGWFDGAKVRQTFDSRTGRMRTIGVRAAPQRWKQAVAIWLGMFPLNVLASWLGSQFSWWGDLPSVARSFLLVSLLVPLMTFIVMPSITRVLQPWLRRNSGVIKSEQALRDALDARCLD